MGPSEWCDDPEPVPKPLELDASEFNDPDLFKALAPILGKGRLPPGWLGTGNGEGQTNGTGSLNSMMFTTCWRPEI